MIGSEYLAVLNMSGPDTGGSSMANGTYRDQSGALMYVSSAQRVAARVKVAFDGATALAGIKFKLVGSGDGVKFGDVLLMRNDKNTIANEHTITPADVTGNPNGLFLFYTWEGSHTGTDGGCKLQAQGVGGAPKAGDNITADVRAM